tara:strand:- start:4381 stop:6789 length:2409 start_codon:yes stop_codon:yes gene_type:complete
MSQRLLQIYNALSAADKAGNTEDAQNLANAYRAEQAAQSQATTQSSTAMRPMRQIAPKQDNAFQYSVDQAQRMGGKGLEAAGRFVGSTPLENYGTSVVEQQDQDLAKGGYAPTHTKSLRDTFNQDGVASAVSWLGEKTAENSVSGGVALIGGVATAAAATVSTPAAAVLGIATLAGSGTMGAGEAAFEQEEKVGDYDAALVVGQGILIGLLDKFGAGKVIPRSRLLKMTGKEITDELTKKGYAQAAAQVAKRFTAEGLTEAAQEGVSMAGAASRGGEYTEDEVLDRGIESFALGVTNSGAAQGVMGAASTTGALVRGQPAGLSDRLAQSTFAQRLEALQRDGDVNGNPYDMNDLDTTSTKGVRALIDAAHVAIGSDIKNLESSLKEYLNPNAKNLTSQEKADRIKIKAMLAQARNKTKSVVGSSDLSLLKSLVGETADGKRLINLVKESQEQTKVWNDGLVGGVSKFTDLANPMPTNSNYSGKAAVTNAIKGATQTGLAVSTGGASLAPQAAIFVGGRMIDKITGRRSKVKRYIAKNKGGDGFGKVTGMGETDKNLAATKKANAAALEKSRQAKAAERMKHYYNYKNNAPANPESPQGYYERFTGMDRAGLEATIEEQLQDPNLDPTIRQEMEDLIESMKYGEKVSGFGALRHINGLINQNPDTAGKRRVRLPEDIATLNKILLAGGGVKESPGYTRGRLDNIAIVEDLKKQLSEDSSVSMIDKKRLDAALNKMANNLGKDPVSTLEAIHKQLLEVGVMQIHLATYFLPYKNRVMQQQEKRGGQPPPPPPVPPPPAPTPPPM